MLYYQKSFKLLSRSLTINSHVVANAVIFIKKKKKLQNFNNT